MYREWREKEPLQPLFYRVKGLKRRASAGKVVAVHKCNTNPKPDVALCWHGDTDRFGCLCDFVLRNRMRR
jgi:hypothetical protein